MGLCAGHAGAVGSGDGSVPALLLQGRGAGEGRAAQRGLLCVPVQDVSSPFVTPGEGAAPLAPQRGPGGSSPVLVTWGGATTRNTFCACRLCDAFEDETTPSGAELQPEVQNPAVLSGCPTWDGCRGGSGIAAPLASVTARGQLGPGAGFAPGGLAAGALVAAIPQLHHVTASLGKEGAGEGSATGVH